VSGPASGHPAGGVPAQPRRAWVQQIMGMPISVHLRGAGIHDEAAGAAVNAVFRDLRAVDAVFSTYRVDSDISRLNRGELAVAACHPSVAEVLDLCDEARRRTAGAFDSHLPGPDGGTWFDPSGLVKGWATERAAAHLGRLAGRLGVDFCLNAGGDVVVGVAGDASPDWRVGLEDPDDVRRIIGVVPLRAGGVATSGSVHRGAHIIDPRTARPADALRAATVTGPSLMWADVFATATIVAGAQALEWIAGLAGYEALVVTPNGDVLATPVFPLEH
jgi:FAD:protein FMN transferase